MQINGRNYHIEQSGQGEPILLLHGFTGDTTIWRDVRDRLPVSYQVIAIDIIGHGQNDKPTNIAAYRMKTVAQDIVTLLDTLAVGRLHLLGYSMGGRLALYLAVNFPERFHSLILESASPGLATQLERDERRERDQLLADKIEANGIEWFVDFWENLSLWQSQKSLSQDVLQSQREQRLRNDPLGLANSLRGMGTGAQPSLWGMLPKLTLPTQLLVGEYDHKFIMINELMAQAIPSAMLVTIPNAGHTAHLENPTAFIVHVNQFLDTVS